MKSVKVRHIVYKVDISSFVNELVYFVSNSIKSSVDITTQEFYDDIDLYLNSFPDVKSARLLGVDVNDNWNFEIYIEVWFKSESKPRKFNIEIDE